MGSFASGEIKGSSGHSQHGFPCSLRAYGPICRVTNDMYLHYEFCMNYMTGKMFKLRDRRTHIHKLIIVPKPDAYGHIYKLRWV